jgi:hypothetical protein
VNVNLGVFGNWLGPTKEFVEWADVVFLNYKRAEKAAHLTPVGC